MTTKRTISIDDLQSILGGAVLAGICIFGVYMLTEGVKEHRKLDRFIEYAVGRELVVRGDTLEITGYSRGGWGVKSGFTLSDGNTVSIDYIKHKLNE